MSRNQNKQYLPSFIIENLFLFAMPSLYTMPKNIRFQYLGLLIVLLATLTACNKKEQAATKPVQIADTSIVEIKPEMTSQFLI